MNCNALVLSALLLINDEEALIVTTKHPSIVFSSFTLWISKHVRLDWVCAGQFQLPAKSSRVVMLTSVCCVELACSLRSCELSGLNLSVGTVVSVSVISAVSSLIPLIPSMKALRHSGNDRHLRCTKSLVPTRRLSVCTGSVHPRMRCMLIWFVPLQGHTSCLDSDVEDDDDDDFTEDLVQAWKLSIGANRYG